VLSDFDSTPFEKVQPESSQDIEKRYKAIKGQPVVYGHAEGVCLTAQTNEEYLKKLVAYREGKKTPIIGVFKGVELSYANLGALAGFTTERGGFLSHAATIAREFRIPYITGIKVDQFEDGDYVILDTENEQVIYRK
jgi:phosphohistidine swiveling domain-containing protein